jgi:hypothetical protein
MDKVKLHSGFIKRIVTAPAPIRAKLLKSSNLEIITAISEIVYNIFHKNIELDKKTLCKVKKFKKVYTKLIKAKDAQARKAILCGNPNCLPPLVTLFK